MLRCFGSGVTQPAAGISYRGERFGSHQVYDVDDVDDVGWHKVDVNHGYQKNSYQVVLMAGSDEEGSRDQVKLLAIFNFEICSFRRTKLRAPSLCSTMIWTKLRTCRCLCATSTCRMFPHRWICSRWIFWPWGCHFFVTLRADLEDCFKCMT